MELKHYVAHIREIHSYIPGFSITCGMYGCPQTFKKFATFRSHLYNIHGGDPDITNQTASLRSSSGNGPFSHPAAENTTNEDNSTAVPDTQPTNVMEEMESESADDEGTNGHRQSTHMHACIDHALTGLLGNRHTNII